MPKLSPKLKMLDKEKIAKINPETLSLYEKYHMNMSIRELSEKTIYGYYNDLANWWIYILDYQDNKSVLEINEEDISEFIVYCKMKGNNTNRIKRRLSSISAFYLFLRKKKLIHENPVEFIDRPKHSQAIVTQTFLTEDQVFQMRQYLQEQINVSKTVASKHTALVMQLYVLFSLSTMARVNAISNVKWTQIDFEDRVAEGVLEKEGYITDLYFSEEVCRLLKNLQDFRRDNNLNDGGYVFISKSYESPQPISKTTLSNYCKQIGKNIGVPTLHPHDFRHSAATIRKNAGEPLEDISYLLNHKSTDVTRRFYIKEDKTKIRANKDKYEF